MTERTCSFESGTADAAMTGIWPEHLLAHLASCASCRETRAVAEFMRRAAAHAGRNEPAPDFARLVLRVRLENDARIEERARRLSLWSQGLSGLAAGLSIWAAVRWVVPVITSSGTSFAIGALATSVTLVILYFASYRPLRRAL